MGNCKKIFNTLYSKIKYSTYGESSFFSEKQLKENELEEIYTYDIEFVENTKEISTAIR